jgi:mxaJ protein
MSSLCRVSLALLLCAAGSTARAAEPLMICAEPANLPYAAQDEQGFEIEVARLLAADIGRVLRVVYAAQRTKDFLRATINAGKCDALMSVPVGSGPLATTKPWYRTGFAAVTRSPAPFELEHATGMTIGLPAGVTAVSLALHRQGAEHVRFYSGFAQRQLVADVATGTLDVGILWGPFAGWLAGAEKAPLTVSLLPTREDQPFALDMAIGVRRNDGALREALNGAIERNRHAIRTILDRWHVPRMEP